jgi:hypothetical protein
MKRIILTIVVVAALLAPGSALAKDYKFLTSADVGGIWWFMYDNNAESIQVDPGLAFGASVVQIIDFEWARGMSLEVSYFHSESRGEQNPTEGENFLFDLTNDFTAVNIGYHFIGRKVHPFLSAGPSVAVFNYERKNNDKIWETDFAINGVGGADWTLWEPSGGLEQVNVGAYVRYIYAFPKTVVDAGLTSLNVMARIQLRF